MVKKELVIVLLILALAAFLRFYQLDQYMNFLGDEGRDALVIEQILVERNLPFIGPPTSVGNMYLGPLYYYMMAIPMAIFWLDPVSAAGMVALIGVATVGLIYYLGRVWYGWVGAAVAATLYAISPVTIVMSRSSWNPNPAPFFALLGFISFDRAHRSGNYWWLVLMGFSLAAALQMHYLSLMLLPVMGVLWLYELISLRRHKRAGRHFWLGSLMSVIVFLAMMSPLLMFDLKHNWLNTRAFQELLFNGSSQSVGYSSMNFLTRLGDIYVYKLIGRYLAGGVWYVSWIVAAAVLVPLVLGLIWKLRGRVMKWSLLALGLWLFIGLLGLTYYKGDVYDHYLGFLNPAPYLLLAGMIALIPGRWRIIAVVVILVGLGWLNLRLNPLLFPPNRQLDRTQEVVRYILESAQGRPYNFALIASRNYDAAYQFYLGQLGQKPGQLPFQPTDQLFVVCEDQVCEPINHSKYEIVAFGWAKIDSENEVAGVKVFKLVPNLD